MLSYALQGLDMAVQRHDGARRERGLVRAYASAAEAVWGVCACDEQLSGGNSRSAHAVARDEHEDGPVVNGLRWVRDRDSHQLAIMTGKDDRSVFDPHR